MSREVQLWDALSKAKYVLRESLHMDRIENLVTPGMPDVEGYLHKMGQFWFELKSEERPTNSETPVRFKMRPRQIEWLRHRWEIGGACFWLLQVGSGTRRRVYMLEGRHGAKIDFGLTEAQIAELDILQSPKFDPAEAIKLAFR